MLFIGFLRLGTPMFDGFREKSVRAFPYRSKKKTPPGVTMGIKARDPEISLTSTGHGPNVQSHPLLNEPLPLS